MEFNKSEGGVWLDKKSLRNGDIAKLVSEAVAEEREFQGKKSVQVVAEVRIKGDDGQARKLAINPATKNALIDAFGKDSKAWCNQLLKVYTEEVRTAGRKGTAVYLIPDGFDHWDDDNGYLVINRKENKPNVPMQSATPNPADIPF